MKKVEADTLEEAYQKAATFLKCSITEMQYEVIQYPSKGILGLFRKKAIIIASCKDKNELSKDVVEEQLSTTPSSISDKKETGDIQEDTTTVEEVVAKEIVDEIQQTSQDLKVVNDTVLDNFFVEKNNTTDEDEESVEYEQNINKELSILIESQLKKLIEVSCFDIDVVEVDVIDKTAYIFMDGEDAALLIGKEGYRYNALSYMLFNWLNSKYELYIKLEIAEFISSQKEMIKNYIKPVIEQVHSKGRAKTRFLDGILVQLALEELREEFPDKYVAIKTAKNGKKFVVINEFNKKNNA